MLHIEPTTTAQSAATDQRQAVKGSATNLSEKVREGVVMVVYVVIIKEGRMERRRKSYIEKERIRKGGRREKGKKGRGGGV